MQSSSALNSKNAKTYLTPEHRLRLYQTLNDLEDEQFRALLSNFTPNSSSTHQYQHHTRVQLFQQCVLLIDNYYSTELEQTIHAMRQKHFPAGYYQQQQQQQQPPSFPIPFNQQGYRFNPSNYRFPPAPAIAQQLRSIRPNVNSSQSTNTQSTRSQISPHQTPHFSQQQTRHSSPSPRTSISNNVSAPTAQRYQVPILSHSSTSSHSLPSTNLSPRLPINKIVHKTLPFYRPITCIHERYHIFHYDQYRKQYMSHDGFLLSLDVCNQLSLSYDYDSTSNSHKTSKRLLLRLARLDQPPSVRGTYDDNLPPNVLIHVNGQALTNLPTPKACTRQQNDLIRIGREIDITSNCMFNPTLKNEIKIVWSYHPDNTTLHIQYANAQYALHVFLVESLAVEDLCEQIRKKPMRFLRDDLVKLLAKARANDRDLGLEVSDQKLKLTCPIDHRRIKKPVRATTCQHLQCFDLTNYIALNEKANKWICPVCNRLALFEDLQIDTYTESILNSISNGNTTEITVNGDLYWSPVFPSNTSNELMNIQSKLHSDSSSANFILIDDED